ncbi:hypothetical protein EP7_004653 [Isosphaeraceae bacterium EP7]
MNSATTRRSFLGAAGLAVGLAETQALAQDAAGQGPNTAPSPRPAPGTGPRPKIAVLASVYHYLSHAYHIAGRFLDGFEVYDGQGLHHPHAEIVSLFIEQLPANDLGRGVAERNKVRLSPTIADALTLGTGKLAVDGILLIGEHGDYPFNAKMQKLYPRGKFFREAAAVLEQSGRGVPIFVDKHLSYDRAEAQSMVDTARRLKAPLMAGSSLPVTWRLPAFEPPLGVPIASALVVSRGEIEIFGFHALESLQCMVERRDRKGKPQGVVAVTCLQGEDVWKAGDEGRWDKSLLPTAIGRSHTLNPGDIRRTTKDFTPPAGRPSYLNEPLAFLVEYTDGLKASVVIANGHVDDTTVALRTPDGKLGSTLFYLPAPPGACFFTPLCLRIEDFFRSGKPPYPAERTLLTGGILDAALESRVRGSVRIETPDLAAIDYAAPANSGFIRTPIADPTPNAI